MLTELAVVLLVPLVFVWSEAETLVLRNAFAVTWRARPPLLEILLEHVHVIGQLLAVSETNVADDFVSG